MRYAFVCMIFVQSVFQCKCNFRCEHFIVLVVAATLFFSIFLFVVVAYDTFTIPLLFFSFSIFNWPDNNCFFYLKNLYGKRDEIKHSFTPHECRNGIFPSTFRSFQSSSVWVLFFRSSCNQLQKFQKKTHFTWMESTWHLSGTEMDILSRLKIELF